MINRKDISTEEALETCEDALNICQEFQEESLKTIKKHQDLKIPNYQKFIVALVMRQNMSSMAILFSLIQTILVNQDKILPDLVMIKKNGKSK